MRPIANLGGFCLLYHFLLGYRKGFHDWDMPVQSHAGGT